MIRPECVKTLLNKVTKFYSCLFTPPPLPTPFHTKFSVLHLDYFSTNHFQTWQLDWFEGILPAVCTDFPSLVSSLRLKQIFEVFGKLESCLHSTFRIVPTIAVMMKEPGLAAKQNLFIGLLAPRPKRHSVVPNRNDWLNMWSVTWNVSVSVLICLFFRVFCLVCPSE